MPNNITNKVRIDASEERIKEILEAIKYDDKGIGTLDFEKIIPMPDNIFRGDLGPDERAKYGKNNWYDFSISSWGSKWNSYGYDDVNKYEGGNEISFETAWSSVKPIIGKLSEMFPDASFEYSWADEDFGMNTGSMVYENGEITEEFVPTGGSKEAYELASEILDCDVLDYGMRLNANGSNYINIENDEYELIELFGKPALFTNERLTDADIPAGLYCCHLRESGSGNGFAAIEPKVGVNHGGSVITDEPMDFSEKGFIQFTDENAPNFMGNTITMEKYMQGDFEQEQGGMNFE